MASPLSDGLPTGRRDVRFPYRRLPV